METSTGSIRHKGQSAIFEFWLKKGETYVIDLRGDGERPLRDPALNVIGDSGQFAEDDNGGAHKNAQLFFAPSKSEFYEVSVFDSTGGTGDFTLDVNADDFRNRPSGVAPSGLVATDARPARGEVNYDGDTDAFATHLIAGLSYNLRLRSAGDDGTKDPALTLLAADGHALASSEDSDGLISYRARTTGDYWLLARDEGHGTGEYALFASVGRGSQLTDRVAGTDGDDSINTLAGDDYVRGGAGRDQIWGASGADTLAGGDDSDTIRGGLNADSIRGGAGSDRLFGEAGRDHIVGGDGNDQISGGDDNDILAGRAGGDVMAGDLGSDRLHGGDGSDSLSGGDGDDRASGSLGSDYISGGAGNDRLAGGDGNDSVSGDEGDDRLSGASGSDYLSGGGGNDDLSGSDGNDTLSGDNGDDRLDGGYDDDQLYGGFGTDEITGGQGNDYLSGDDGNDVLNGGRDGDTYWGGDGRDVFLFAKVSDSTVADNDTVYSFERPGATEGDLFDLSGIDADRTLPGGQALVFGAGTGIGSVWLRNDTVRHSTDTLLYANVDNDRDPEFMVRITDGKALTAREYGETDFVL